MRLRVCSWLHQVFRIPVLGRRHCGGMSCMRPLQLHSLAALRYARSPANTSLSALVQGLIKKVLMPGLRTPN